MAREQHVDQGEQSTDAPENGGRRDHSSFLDLLMSYNLNNRIAQPDSGEIFRLTGYFAAREYFENPNPSFGSFLRNAWQVQKSICQGKPPYPITGELRLIECGNVASLPTSVDIHRHVDGSVSVGDVPQARVMFGGAKVAQTLDGAYETQSYEYQPPDEVLAEMVTASHGKIIGIRRSDDGLRSQYLVGFGVVSEESLQRLAQSWPVVDGLYTPSDR